MRALPPDFCLHAVSDPVRLVAVRGPADKTSESIRPVRISDKGSQNRSAEKVSASRDLRGDGEFSEPAAIKSLPAVGVVEAWLERYREMLGEAVDWPRPERYPLIRSILLSSTLVTLIDEDRHD